MDTGLIVALALTVLVGLSLGALGGGGSVLMLPILVYVAGTSAHEAVPLSMVVVGGTSLLAAVLHSRRGNIHVRATVLFGLSGMAAAFLGSALTSLVSQRVLMLIFAALMLAAGVAMLRGRAEEPDEGSGRCRVLPCLLVGAGVGALTGFLGVGGGFLIVPALVLFVGLPTKPAIGSSLAIIALNAASGLVGQLRQTTLDWGLALGYLGLALVGMLGGLALAGKVSGPTLRTAFAWFIIVLAVVIGGMNALGFEMPYLDRRFETFPSCMNRHRRVFACPLMSYLVAIAPLH